MEKKMKFYPKYKAYGTVGIEVLEPTLLESAKGPNIIATIPNEADQTLKVYVDDLEGWYTEPLKIVPGGHLDLLANDEDRNTLSFIKDGDFKAVLEPAG